MHVFHVLCEKNDFSMSMHVYHVCIRLYALYSFNLTVIIYFIQWIQFYTFNVIHILKEIVFNRQYTLYSIV
jgi:uncharacterized membrane protein